MAKKTRKMGGPKATQGDIVIHNGKRWTVLDREYDRKTEQSYYHLSATAKSMAGMSKWVRSDYINVR